MKYPKILLLILSASLFFSTVVMTTSNATPETNVRTVTLKSPVHKEELPNIFKLQAIPVKVSDNHHHAHSEYNESHSNDVRAGYRWYCQSCNFTSAWHIFYLTASKRANSHTIRTGHATVTYGV